MRNINMKNIKTYIEYLNEAVDFFEKGKLWLYNNKVVSVVSSIPQNKMVLKLKDTRSNEILIGKKGDLTPYTPFKKEEPILTPIVNKVRNKTNENELVAKINNSLDYLRKDGFECECEFDSRVGNMLNLDLLYLKIGWSKKSECNTTYALKSIKTVLKYWNTYKRDNQDSYGLYLELFGFLFEVPQFISSIDNLFVLDISRNYIKILNNIPNAVKHLFLHDNPLKSLAEIDDIPLISINVNNISGLDIEEYQQKNPSVTVYK